MPYDGGAVSLFCRLSFPVSGTFLIVYNVTPFGGCLWILSVSWIGGYRRLKMISVSRRMG